MRPWMPLPAFAPLVVAACSADAGEVGVYERDTGAFDDGGADDASTGASAAPDASEGGLSGPGTVAGVGRVACFRSWPTVFASGPGTIGGRTTRGAVAVDPAGDILVAATFSGSVTIGTDALPSAGGNDGLVVKLDAACNVLWTRTFGGAQAHVYLDAVAADAAGDVYVGGALSGTVDFGSGGVAGSLQSALVVKLAPDGATLWAEAFPRGGGFSDAVDALAVAPAGTVAVAAEGLTVADFGGTPLTSSPGRGSLFGLDTGGAVGFAVDDHDIGGGAPDSPGAVAAGPGGIWIAGTSSTSDANGSTEAVARLDASGHVVWARSLPTPQGASAAVPSFVATDAAGRATVLSTWSFREDNGANVIRRAVSRFSDSGEVVWSDVPVDLVEPLDVTGDLLAVDDAGRAFVGGAITAPYDGGDLGELGLAGAEDITVVVVDPSGRVSALGSAGFAGWISTPSALAAAPGPAVVVVGTRSPVNDSSAVEILVAKIAW